MVGASNSVAMRRMLSAANPSASAISMAARTTWSRVSPWAGPRRTLARPLRPGEGGSVPVTTMPTPGTARTRLSCRRTVRARLAVAMATPHSRTICRVDGTRSPGLNSPAVMRRRNSATMRR